MIARVFPSRTAQTPVDDYAFVGDPPIWLPPDITFDEMGGLEIEIVGNIHDNPELLEEGDDERE